MAFPANRSEVSYQSIHHILTPNNPQSLDFVADHEGYIHSAVSASTSIIGNESCGVAGADFCVLDIDPFKESHPIAKLASGVDRETEEKFPVTILGYSL